MTGIFVTGTDTDVGKTALTALLLTEWRRRGIDAVPMKPAQTGCAGDGVPDLDYALSLSGASFPPDARALMAPYRFEPACSPHLAAERAGTRIEISVILSAAERLAERHDRLVVEGAGGLLVPLNRRETMLDLAKALRLPVVVVARPGLGTINHTLMTLEILRSAEARIAGVVFVASTPDEPGFIERDNVETIRKIGAVPILGTIPNDPELAQALPRLGRLTPAVVDAARVLADRLEAR